MKRGLISIGHGFGAIRSFYFTFTLLPLSSYKYVQLCLNNAAVESKIVEEGE